MKRRSTRHISEITAVASEYGNSAKIVPTSWLRKQMIAFLHSEYISKHRGWYAPVRTSWQYSFSYTFWNVSMVVIGVLMQPLWSLLQLLSLNLFLW